jgi:squalene-associated FAD-dependent desaturase
VDRLAHLGGDTLNTARTGRRVAVVGAGWAGLSAAVHLGEAGHRCTLFEAARSAGGRARRLNWALADGSELSIDNGQHILLGAYRATLDLLACLGIEADAVLERLPLTLYGAGLHLRAAPLPAPWHLLLAIVRARGLSWPDRLAMLRFMRALQSMRWRLDQDTSLAHLLDHYDQSPRLRQLVWEPLCLAALNTPAAQASAQVFVHVLRDSLGGARHASDLLLPRVDLGAVLPDAALAHIASRGEVRLGTRVTAVHARTDVVELEHTGPGTVSRIDTFDAVVLAVPAPQSATLLTGDPACAALAQQCAALEHQSITTVYLRYACPAGTRALLPFPMHALHEDAARACYGQWAFDRSALCGTPGVISVVISADGPHRDLTAPALVHAVRAQLREQAGLHGKVADMRVLVEKRATFACLPDLDRPSTRTPHARLVLAGDHVASDYPATLEGAVRSGQRAALALQTILG